MWVQIPNGKGQFSGVVRAIQKHWQFSLQRRGCVRCKMDHSVSNNVMQQKGSFSTPGKQNFRAQSIRSIGRKRGGGIAQRRRSLITTIAFLFLWAAFKLLSI